MEYEDLKKVVDLLHNNTVPTFDAYFEVGEIVEVIRPSYPSLNIGERYKITDYSPPHQMTWCYTMPAYVIAENLITKKIVECHANRFRKVD